MEKFKQNDLRYTIIPHSELALHLGIAGKMGRIVEIVGNWAIVELNGKMYEGLPSELIDIGNR